MNVRIRIAAAAFAVGLCSVAAAFPTKPVKLVVPYPPGGFPDTVARIVAKALSEKWGQQVLVENKPGGNGTVSAQALKSAPADGHTLLITDGSMFTINPALYAKLEYDPKNDFVPVTAIARAPLFWTAHPSVPANTFPEFVTYVKANPGKISYGSSGIGSTHHLSTEAMSAALGLNMVHIPYKGMGQATPALVGGQIQVLFSALPAIAGFVKDGRVKLLAQNSSQRFSGQPQIPTIAESGVSGFNFAPTTIAMVLAGTPTAVVKQLSADLVSVVKSASVSETLLNAGVETIGSSSDELARQLASEAERFSKTIREINIKPE
jgi:tripartite-type tricarboxylate transporter receptor subunit TctC